MFQREVALVPATGYPFQMAGGVPVVTASAEIDAATAGELRAILVEWQRRGNTTVVVDLSGTQFCDSAGLRELVSAHNRAVADGGGLWLVIPAESVVARIFTVTGLEGIIPRFATLGEALAQVPACAARPLRRGTAPESAAAPASAPSHIGGHGGPLAERRSCEQCGAVFVPRREHARFCSGDCRAVWNRQHLGDPAVEASALTWSIAAMSEATGRLPAVKVWDQEQAFAAIGEAVWWITMVDATLVRHHSRIYDRVLAAHAPDERQRIEETLAGWRFVRNWISREGRLGEAIEPGTGNRRITGWTWTPIARPALAWLPPRAQAWELARYQAYHARLAGHTIGKTLGRAVTFLTLTGADAASNADTSQFRLPASTAASCVRQSIEGG
jgi:anti-anti-sigma factor